MTSKEWNEKTVKDIAKKRVLQAEGKRQAIAHGINNIDKIKRRIR